jgi:hypothetical protein
MTRPPFPETIDSTILGTFRSCQQKMFRQYMEHWKPNAESVHLVAGGAFAAGVEYARRAFYVDGKTQEEAEAIGLRALTSKYGDFQCPPESAKSLERMMGALVFYLEQYPLGNDGAIPIDRAGVRGIEFSFAEPLPVMHPVTGNPLLYTGRADMIAEFAGGKYAYDEKTATSLGAQWANQWDMRSQFTGYCWASRQSGMPLNGVIVRGVSILKTKYDTMQAISYRPDWFIDRWLEQVVRDLQNMIRAWESGVWDFNLDHACEEYGGCAFKKVCLSNNPEAWLEGYFVKRKWDPLIREEVAI